MPVKGAEKIKMERTLRDISPGETVYSVPWALLIDRSGSAYLDLTRAASKRSSGIKIRVRKISLDNYEVDVNSIYETKAGKKYKWIITNTEDLPENDILYLGKIPSSIFIEKKSTSK